MGGRVSRFHSCQQVATPVYPPCKITNFYNQLEHANVKSGDFLMFSIVVIPIRTPRVVS